MEPLLAIGGDPNEHPQEEETKGEVNEGTNLGESSNALLAQIDELTAKLKVVEAALAHERANAESLRSQLEEAKAAGSGQGAAGASSTPTTAAPGSDDLSDATRVGEFAWADLREAAMEPDYLESSAFVSPLLLCGNST